MLATEHLWWLLMSASVLEVHHQCAYPCFALSFHHAAILQLNTFAPINTDIVRDIHMWTHTHRDTQKLTQIHMHTRMHTHTHTHTHSHTLPHTHKHMNTELVEKTIVRNQVCSGLFLMDAHAWA